MGALEFSDENLSWELTNPSLSFFLHKCFSSVQFSSVTQSCRTLCDSMNCSRPGLPAHHQLPEFIQTHVHWVGDAIQPSNPLLFPSPPAFNLSPHQGLFKWVSTSHQVAKVLELLLGITHAVLARDSARFMFLNFLLLEDELTKQTLFTMLVTFRSMICCSKCHVCRWNCGEKVSQ